MSKHPDLSQLPAIRVRQGRMPGEPKRKFGAAPLQSSTANGMDNTQTLIFFGSRVAECEAATERKTSGLFGKFINTLRSETPTYVILPGAVLMRVMKRFQDLPEWMDENGEYELRLDVAQRLLKQFRAYVQENDTYGIHS